ncbi:hypothetical protein GYH30_035238 [Glycine max]|nr:hypothetical protein GYH30_035238 [Glycine max]
MAKAVASGQQSDDIGILIRLLRSDLPSSMPPNVGDAAVAGSGHHWTSLAQPLRLWLVGECCLLFDGTVTLVVPLLFAFHGI